MGSLNQTASSGRPVIASVDTDWFKDRLAAQGKNQRALAKYLELDPGAVSLMLRGMRKVTMEEAAKLSRFLNQPLGEIAERAGIRESLPGKPGEVDIIGFVDGNGEAHIGEPVGTAPRPPDLIGDDTAALLYRTAATVREMYDGWIIFYKRVKTVDPDCIGRLTIAQLANGGPIVVRLARRGYAPKTLNLVTPIDTPIESARVDWATPVLWIKT